MTDCRDDTILLGERCLKRQHALLQFLWRQECPLCGAAFRDRGACGMDQQAVPVPAPHSATFWLGADG